jgi:hypothetical protein
MTKATAIMTGEIADELVSVRSGEVEKVTVICRLIQPE